MRSDIQNPNVCSFASQPHALAVIYYDGTDTSAMPNSTAQAYTDPGTCANDPLSETVPLATQAAVAKPDVSLTMNVNVTLNATLQVQWSFNESPSVYDYNDPILGDLFAGNTTFPAKYNVINTGTNGTVRIVVNNFSRAPHPIHFHAHNFQVLSEGPGNDWDGTITNPSNPQRRDAQILRPNDFSVPQSDST